MLSRNTFLLSLAIVCAMASTSFAATFVEHLTFSDGTEIRVTATFTDGLFSDSIDMEVKYTEGTGCKELVEAAIQAHPDLGANPQDVDEWEDGWDGSSPLELLPSEEAAFSDDADTYNDFFGNHVWGPYLASDNGMTVRICVTIRDCDQPATAERKCTGWFTATW